MGETVGEKSLEVSRLFLKVSPTKNEYLKAHDMVTDSWRDMRTVVQSQSVGLEFVYRDVQYRDVPN